MNTVKKRPIIEEKYTCISLLKFHSFGTDLTVRTSTAPPVFLIMDFTDAYSQMTKPKITKAVGGLLVMSTTSF